MALNKMALSKYASEAANAARDLGITVKRIPVNTDPRAVAYASSAAAQAAANPNMTQVFVAEVGSSITLNAGQITAINAAIRAYIESVFTTEAALYTQINYGQVTTREQIDAEFAAVKRTY